MLHSKRLKEIITNIFPSLKNKEVHSDATSRFTIFSQKKGQGSSKNGRDSESNVLELNVLMASK